MAHRIKTTHFPLYCNNTNTFNLFRSLSFIDENKLAASHTIEKVVNVIFCAWNLRAQHHKMPIWMRGFCVCTCAIFAVHTDSHFVPFRSVLFGIFRILNSDSHRFLFPRLLHIVTMHMQSNFAALNYVGRCSFHLFAICFTSCLVRACFFPVPSLCLCLYLT